MAIPTTRQQLAEYALVRLGKPAITIDVTTEQIDDRLDDALAFFAEFHYDATERVFYKRQLTQDDIDNRSLPMDPSIVSILNVVAMPESQVNMFDVRYQVALNDFYNWNNVSMVHYSIVRQHLALLDFLFNVKPTIRFNRKSDKIYVDINWGESKVGDWIIFDAMAILDPVNYPKIYNDRWLKDYVTAIIQEQWGLNLSKYNGVALIGGVTVDGVRILRDAEAKIRELREEVENRYQEPPMFTIG